MTTPFGIGDLSAMGLPGGNPLQGAGILETMELVRKAWASFSLPPNMAPTMDPDEVARRVSELKAVEQWLTMNLAMLRGTIQALEIQQGTLAALHAFGAAGAAAGAPPGREAASARSTVHAPPEPPAAPEPDTTPAPESAPMPDALNPVAWWDMLQKQFGEVAAAALAGVPAAIDAAHLAAGTAGADTGAAAATDAARAGGRDSPGKARATRAASGTAPDKKPPARGKAGAAASKRGARRGSARG